MTELSEGKEIRFKVSCELLKAVKELAKEDDRSVSEYIRRMLKDVIEAHMNGVLIKYD